MCAEMRSVVPQFASTRNKIGMEPSRIITEPFPPGLHIKPDPSKHPKKKPLGKPLPQQTPAPSTSDTEEPHRPPGPIAIEQLYLPGVYAKKVRQFFSECDAAFIALQDRMRGSERDIPRVNTVVIKQDEQPMWARGIVWDYNDRNMPYVRRISLIFELHLPHIWKLWCAAVQKTPRMRTQTDFRKRL